MKLREEIDSIIKLIHNCEQHDNVYYTHEILKLFEKLIDDHSKNYKLYTIYRALDDLKEELRK